MIRLQRRAWYCAGLAVSGAALLLTASSVLGCSPRPRSTAQGEGSVAQQAQQAQQVLRAERITATRSGTSAAVYFALVNTTPSARVIVAVRVVGGAGEASLHETTVEDDVMRMREVPSASVPAGETLEFEPGGLHLMLSGLGPTTPQLELELALDDGTTLPFEVIFKVSGAIHAEGALGGSCSGLELDCIW